MGYISFFVLGIITGILLNIHFSLNRIPLLRRILVTKYESELEKEIKILKNQISEYEKEIKSKEEKLFNEDIKLARKRISYLKKLAFADGDFNPAERYIIFDYILSQDGLNEELIVEEMREFFKNPNTIRNRLKDTVLPENPRNMFKHKEEAEEFLEVLQSLAIADEVITKKEKQLIDRIKKTYKIP